jgi:hypothetical protein
MQKFTLDIAKHGGRPIVVLFVKSSWDAGIVYIRRTLQP